MTSILLVEDDRNQRLLYEQELRFEGYGIVTAADAYIVKSSDLIELKSKIKEMITNKARNPI